VAASASSAEATNGANVGTAGNGDQTDIPWIAPRTAGPSRPRAAAGTHQAWASVRQAQTWVPTASTTIAPGSHRAHVRGVMRSRPAAKATPTPVRPTYR
jgi:hypothetical protein